MVIAMEIIIASGGAVRAVYSEEINLGCLGSPTITRASHVEPDEQGRWHADLALVNGPVLGPFTRRSQGWPLSMSGSLRIGGPGQLTPNYPLLLARFGGGCVSHRRPVAEPRRGPCHQRHRPAPAAQDPRRVIHRRPHHLQPGKEGIRMPLKTNVGVSRKVADNNYGSRGASVTLEVELDSSLIQEPERFQDRIRQVFRMAQQAVDEELARQSAPNGQDNGHAVANGNGNGHAGQRWSSGRKATASQVRAIHAIVNRQGLDLVSTLRERFGVEFAEDLAISEASQLIDQLKGVANSAGGRG